MGIGDEPITYDLSLAPAGMTVDPRSGLLAWRPTIEQVGEHLVVLRATSESESIALQDFHLEVAAPNTAPQLSVVPPLVAYVDLTYAVDFAAQDAEQQMVSFSLLSGPSGATLDAATGHLRWTPAFGDIGSEFFSIELRDELGAATVVDFTVDVLDSQPATTPLNIAFPRTEVGLGQDYVGRISGTDALGRSLTWSLISAPLGMTVSESGNLTWTPSSSNLGEHTVELRATDLDGLIETITYTLLVVGRPVISRPVILSKPIVSTVIDRDYRYDVDFNDADADTVAFELLDSPIGMSIHPSLGTVHWTPTAEQSGESKVTIQVTDPDGQADTQSFLLKVSQFGGPPVINSVPPTHSAVGAGYLYTVTASDAEGDPLTYRLLAAPAGMTIVDITGEIAWTPTADQLGLQEIVIEVSDGVGGAVTQAFAIRVNEGVPNSPPQITTTAPRFGAVGATYHYQLQARDPEATELTFAHGQAPTGMAIDTSTGQLTWTPEIEQVGKHVVTLRVTDAGGAAAIESFELDILAENRPPLITGSAPVEVPAGATFRYDLRATDADFDQLSFELLAAPGGATVDSFGRIMWKTSVADLGSHAFEVAVSDPRGGQATQEFLLNVIEDIEGPRVSLIVSPDSDSRNVLPWQGPFRVYVRAIDNVEVSAVTLQANGRDIALDAAGTATFSFEDWTFSKISATATGIDIYGNTTAKTIEFNFAFPEGWSGEGLENVPTAVITSPTDTAPVTGMVSITGTAAHETFSAYKLSYRRVDESQFIEFFHSETPVESGQLGIWDTSLLINDEYVIRLEVANEQGVVNVAEHHVGLGGELKLGNFRISFTDMVVPVAGIPIEITRIYDTLQADRQGAFGYGWRLDYRDTDLRVGLPTSGLEDIGIYSALRPGVKVFLNVPGQGRQGFTFNPDIRVLPGFGGNNLVLARPRFTPDPGVTSKLSTGTNSYLQVNEQGELHAPGGIPYNPASPNFGGAYLLTTKDGYTYRIDGQSGQLTLATDRNGVHLVFSEGGVRSSGGRELSIERDSSGRVVAVIDPRGNRVGYAYSTAGDLVASIDQRGNTTTYAYDPSRPHYLQDITDPLGRRGVRSEYDADGRLLRQIDAGGASYELAVDPLATIQSVTDPLGNKSTYIYDNRGNLLNVLDPLGNLTAFTYSSQNNLPSQTNPLGQTTRYDYDAAGNRTRMIDAAGGVTRMRYNGFGQVTSLTDATGRTTTNEYDDYGNLIAQRDPLGNGYTQSFDYGYDPAGQLTSLTNTNGAESTMQIDSAGQIVEIRALDGQVQSVSYDALGYESGATVGDKSVEIINDLLGRPLQTTFSSGLQLSNQYDALGRLTRQAIGEAVATRAFDGAGRLVEQVNTQGEHTTFAYDAVGNLLQERFEPTGATRSYKYDAAGRRVGATISGLGSKADLDAAGRPIRVDFADGGSELVRYDNVGNVIERKTRDGLTFRYRYNALNELEEVIDPYGSITRHGFDGANRADSYTDALGRTTEIALDSLGNRVFKRLPLGQTATFSYDNAGIPNQRTGYDGRTQFLEYDDHRRLTRVTNQSGDILESHEYPTERTSTVTTRYGVTSTATTRQGQLLNLTSVNGFNTDYLYSATEVLTGLTTDFGTTEIGFEVLGITSNIITPDANEIIFTYDSNGQLLDVNYSTGLRRAQVNDAFTLPVSYSYENGEGQAVLQRDLTRDSHDRITAVIAEDGTRQSFEYDTLGRLRRETLRDSSGEVTRTTDYEYDAVGNLTRTVRNDVEIVRTYDANDRLTRSGDWTVESDATGNMIRRSDGTTFETYDYDEFQKLVRFERTGVDPVVVEYRYDRDGLIATRTVDGVAMDYVWDRSGGAPFLYEVIDRSRDLVRRYHNDGARYVAYEDTAGAMSVIATDSRGTPIGVIDQSGSLQSIHYDAFGNLLTENPLEIGFAGGLADPDSGLTHFASRWYDPTNGRFTQTDDAPADDFDTRSLNRYVYSLNDPVNRIDPLGQSSFIETLSSLKVQATLALVTAVAVGSGAAEFVLWGLSGGRVNFDDVNITGSTRPFLEVSRGRLMKSSGKDTFSRGRVSRGAELQLGLELLSLGRAPASSLFGFLGVGLGFSVDVGTGGSFYFQMFASVFT